MGAIRRGWKEPMFRRLFTTVVPRLVSAGAAHGLGAMSACVGQYGSRTEAHEQQACEEAAKQAADTRADAEDGTHGQQTRRRDREFQPAQKYVARPNWKPARRAGSLPWRSRIRS